MAAVASLVSAQETGACARPAESVPKHDHRMAGHLRDGPPAPEAEPEAEPEASGFSHDPEAVFHFASLDECKAATRSLTWEEIEAALTTPGTSIQRLYRAIFTIKQSAGDDVASAISMLRRALEVTDEAEGPADPEPSGPEEPSSGGSGAGCGPGSSTAPSPPPASPARWLHPSLLFRHECCYLLGQIGADVAAPELKLKTYEALNKVLRDTREDEVTRHEAAEGITATVVYNSEASASTEAAGEEQRAALAAARGEVLEQLQRLSSAAAADCPLGSTCRIALDGLRKLGRSKVCACQYKSYDPAIGDPAAVPGDVPRLAATLRDADAPLFDRYVAMFTLRNLGAWEELAGVLEGDTSSCVLRHEVAFILGQSESLAGVRGLVGSLASRDHAMVRHEAAIALGSIGGHTAATALRRHSEDEDQMVRESCLVALDTMRYWEAWEELEARIQAQ